MKSFFVISFILILYSCDFSTHEYISYVENKNTFEEVLVGWGSDSTCYVSVDDTTLLFDEIELVFPSDNSSLISERTSFYTREYIDHVLQEDSTLNWSYHIDLKETDDRVLVNDSIYARIKKGNRVIKKLTLFKEKSESSFIDRLGIPKTC